MPLAWPNQVRGYMALVDEAKQINVDILAELFSDEPGGQFARLGVTETSVESLFAAADMLKLALDE